MPLATLKYKEYSVGVISGQSPAGGDPDHIANTYLGNWNLISADGNPENIFKAAVTSEGSEALLKIKIWTEEGKNRFSLFMDTSPVATNLDRGLILSPGDITNLPEDFQISVQGNYIFKMKMQCKKAMVVRRNRIPTNGSSNRILEDPARNAPKRVESLISVAENSDGTKIVGQVLAITLKLIRPMVGQPRKNFDPVELEEFARHLIEQGQLQPAIVKPLDSPDENGCIYELISGERRWRACQIAGIPSLLCILSRPVNKTQQYVDAVVANCHGVELSLLETIQSVGDLYAMGKTDSEIAKIFGKKSEAWASDRRKALTLEVEVLKLLGPETPEDLRIPFNTAKLLIGLPRGDQLKYGPMASKSGISATKLNFLVKHVRLEQGLHTTRVRPNDDFDAIGKMFANTNSHVENIIDYSENQLIALFLNRDVRHVKILMNDIKDLRDNLSALQKAFFEKARNIPGFIG